MPGYAAFLRAINVGGRNVKMQELQRIFAANGIADPKTFIASGNVLFESRSKAAALEKKIEAFLQTELGYRVDTFVRPLAGLAAIADHAAFAGVEEGHTIHVAFLAREPDEAARDKLAAWPDPVDAFHVHGHEVYWLCRIRSSDSRFSGAVLEKMLGQPATLRNLKTVRKLAAMA